MTSHCLGRCNALTIHLSRRSRTAKAERITFAFRRPPTSACRAVVSTEAGPPSSHLSRLTSHFPLPPPSFPSSFVILLGRVTYHFLFPAQPPAPSASIGHPLCRTLLRLCDRCA